MQLYMSTTLRVNLRVILKLICDSTDKLRVVLAYVLMCVCEVFFFLTFQRTDYHSKQIDE